MAATIAIVDTASMTWRLDNIVKISLCAVVNLKKCVQQKLAKPPSNIMLFTNVNSTSCAETTSLWHSSLKIIKFDTVVNVICVSETLLKMSATINCLEFMEVDIRVPLSLQKYFAGFSPLFVNGSARISVATHAAACSKLHGRTIFVTSDAVGINGGPTSFYHYAFA